MYGNKCESVADYIDLNTSSALVHFKDYRQLRISRTST